MIQSKKLNIVVFIALVFALIVCSSFVVIGNKQQATSSMKTDAEYATRIFGTDIISIEIIADEADWLEMLDNARSEQYIMVDVVVNGTKFKNVGIRPKGNSSLSQVAGSNSDRYSFNLKFDEYIKDQTCFGLDSFVVNNMLGDNTYMKEYVSYDLMHQMGVDAPYFGFADIKVNGKEWGLYLAVEAYRDSYEARTFGTTAGMLYNVKSMDIGGDNRNGGNFPMGGFQPPTDRQGGNFPQNGVQPPTDRQGGNLPQGGMQPPSDRQGGNFPRDGVQPPIDGQGGNFPQGGMQPPSDTQGGNERFERPNGMFGGGPMGGRGSNGGSLEYTTDDVSSYSAIFNNVVGKGSNSDYKRVITALKALSKGENLETYFDIDQILKYLAAHTVVVNLDSYSSGMAQNYYLYENKGKVTILPWDYNLAWGGFQNGSASSVINFPIDTPVSGVEMSSRPLIKKLFANKEYLEKYHEYLQQLMTNYFADGKWEEKITDLDMIISDYVKNDQTAFCTFEEYKTAVETFKKIGQLRYKSIQGQLDGTVPSTTAEQAANPDKLIPSDNINLSSLGSMMGGGNRGGMGNRQNNSNNNQAEEAFNPFQMGNMPDPQLMMKAMQILQDAGGTVTDEVKSKLLDLGLTEEEISMFTTMGNGFMPRQGGNMRNPAGNNTRLTPNNGNRTFPLQGQGNNRRVATQSLLTYSGLFAFMLVSAFFVARKKRNY